MWIFTTSGFLSIVQHKDADGHFQIKSRVRAPLEDLWPDHEILEIGWACLLYTSPSPRDGLLSRMPSSA